MNKAGYSQRLAFDQIKISLYPFLRVPAEKSRLLVVSHALSCNRQGIHQWLLLGAIQKLRKVRWRIGRSRFEMSSTTRFPSSLKICNSRSPLSG